MLKQQRIDYCDLKSVASCLAVIMSKRVLDITCPEFRAVRHEMSHLITFKEDTRVLCCVCLDDCPADKMYQDE